MTMAMPPRMATDASSMRSVGASPSRTMPPTAAMIGTLSCTVAQLPKDLGKLAVDQAVKALTGKADATVPVMTSVITAANVATFKG